MLTRLGILLLVSTLLLFKLKTEEAQQLATNIPDVEKIKPLRIYAATTVQLQPLLCEKIVRFSDIPLDVCYVRTNTVAVALGSVNKTALVDVEKNRVIKIVRLSHKFDGVAVDDNMMVVSSDEKSTLINLNDMCCTILQGVRANHISLFKGNLYGVIDENNESRVSCYKNNGEHIWTFTHREIDEARGLALDKNGCHYIASSNNNSIVVVSPDGKRCSSILSEHDGIHWLWSIDINTESGLMMVPYDSSGEWDTESFDSAFVYKIPNV
ncbi:unnamed protein product [Mytilus edulis]|uniref:Uncharacterized protein n=1 Tax=Mytilus edulis TaxID=6550 RepID=A0A8S3VP72_MYTED|nr:unnamed protein product [Mytilus edulis]